MSDSKIQYHFISFKLYAAGLIILFLISLLSWLPKAEIDLVVSSEPLIMNFEIKLDTQVQAILFAFNTLPARIVNLDRFIDDQKYRLIDDLVDDQTKEIIIFQESDLQELIDYKTKDVLISAGEKKQVFKFHPEKWEIKVLNRNISAGQATILISLQEEVIGVYNFDSLKQEIRLMNISLAKDTLKKIFTVKNVKIKIWPQVYGRIPIFDKRIHFSVYPVGI
ncbi:hypothetical protein IID20_02900 [Patescibacteria group bacterium]|nr:hypothetical protein [Patescibacteria group bacterium]